MNVDRRSGLPDVGLSASGKPTIFRGRSTDLEVGGVLKLVQEASYGDLLSYKQFEEIVGHEHSHTRFRTVMSRASRLCLKELHRVIKAQANEGYVVLHPSEQVMDGVRDMRCATRRVSRGVVKAALADRSLMSDTDKKAADFVAARGADIQRFLRSESLALSKVAQTKLLPSSQSD